MNISFVVPVHNTNYEILRVCVNSILHCLQDRHELILVDDASSATGTIEFLRKCASSPDFNIKVLRNAENNGVSYSLNKGIAESQGSFISPVDHDDLVWPIGLNVAMRHQQYYRLSWFYTDELQVDEKGYFIRYLFKPDYSPKLLQSVMYINHLQIYSKALVDQVGGYREGLEGSQDHDLALRMSEVVNPHHVPSIGYHWRIMPTTQSRTAGMVRTASIESSTKALRAHCNRLGKTVTVVNARRDLSVYKIRIVPEYIPKISIIIPCKLGTTRTINGRTVTLLTNCLQSLKRTAFSQTSLGGAPEIEVILILNAEDDSEISNSLIEGHGFSGFSVNDAPGFNFSRKCNLGAKVCSGDILVFLNDDTEFISENWTTDVISLIMEDNVACIGGMLLNEDKTVQSCGDNVSLNSATHYDPNPSSDNEGDPFHRYHADHETTSITGAFMACKKDTFEKLQGFNEVFSNSFQDVDFCLRARKQGLRCLLSPHIKLFHYESSSRDPQVDDETLSTLRSFHSDLIAQKDEFALWAYQPVRVPWISLSRIVHTRNQIRNNLESLRGAILRVVSSRPRVRFELLIK
jgi:GT2 family glycosyltransferase